MAEVFGISKLASDRSFLSVRRVIQPQEMGVSLALEKIEAATFLIAAGRCAVVGGSWCFCKCVPPMSSAKQRRVNPIPPNLRLLRRLEAADVLGISPATFDRKRKKGEIGPPRFRRPDRWLAADLLGGDR